MLKSSRRAALSCGAPQIMKEAIISAFEESIRVKRAFLQDNLDALVRVIETISTAFETGHKLLLFGNGGSAADAQHIAAEFVNRFLIERPPLPAVALTTDASVLTSIANDDGYEQIFAKQVRALGTKGDVALAISTSGNSANVLAALDACKALNIITVGLTGGAGGKMAVQVDYLLRASEGQTSARIQETHILVGHVICDMVDQRLFPS
jgi:D-sedoheptulose 7-phosphate isomerase